MADQPSHYNDIARHEVLPFVPRDASRILDVGCLSGGFGAALKADRPGTVVWGIEPLAEPGRLASARLDHAVVGRFPDDLPTGERFDCLVFNDVLEHLEDPWVALRASIDHLTSNGVVVASIPNVRHYSVVAALVRRGDWQYGDGGILDRNHLRFFTRRSMTRMFEECGFVVDQCIPINITPPRDRLNRLLHLAGRRGTDFLADQFVVVARTPPPKT